MKKIGLVMAFSEVVVNSRSLEMKYDLEICNELNGMIKSQELLKS